MKTITLFTLILLFTFSNTFAKDICSRFNSISDLKKIVTIDSSKFKVYQNAKLEDKIFKILKKKNPTLEKIEFINRRKIKDDINLLEVNFNVGDSPYWASSPFEYYIQNKTSVKSISSQIESLDDGAEVYRLGSDYIVLEKNKYSYFVTSNSQECYKPIYEPSFSCSQKLNKVEKIICEDNELRYLDMKLSSVYKNSNNPDKLITQRSWLAKRNRCDDSECIKDHYDARLMALEGFRISSSIIANDTEKSIFKAYNENLEINQLTKLSEGNYIPTYGPEPYRDHDNPFALSGKTLLLLLSNISYYVSPTLEYVKNISTSLSYANLRNLTSIFLLTNYKWESKKNSNYLEDIGEKYNNEYAEYVFTDQKVELNGLRRESVWGSYDYKKLFTLELYWTISNREIVNAAKLNKSEKENAWKWAMAKWLYRRGPALGYLYSKALLLAHDAAKKDKESCEATQKKSISLFKQIQKDNHYKYKVLYRKDLSKKYDFSFIKDFPPGKHCNW